MPRFAFLVVSLAVFVGCEKRNPLFCPHGHNSDATGCLDVDASPNEPPDAPPSRLCTSSNDCMSTPSTPVCENKLSPPKCVQCTSENKGICTGTTPLCASNRCTACINNADCDISGLCLPDGACATAASIIHAVSTGGLDTSGCGSPAGPCTLERALTQVTVTKKVIKLDDNGPYATSNNFVVDAQDTNITTVTIDARGSADGGAVLLPGQSDKPILTLTGGKIVTIFGGTIKSALNSDGISCVNATLTVDGTTINTIDKSAINAGTGCNLTVTNATISGTSVKNNTLVPSILAAGTSITLSRSSLYANKGGGIMITKGTFVIVGNAFLSNGDPTSPVGAVSITTVSSDPMNRLEFNTIASNQAISLGNAPGVHCTVGAGPIARNNIIWDNNGNSAPQVSGQCKHAYSDIGMMSVGGANDGGHNLSVDPMFVMPTYDLHLQPGSPMIMKADPMAQLAGVAAKDADGDPRIAPADIGTDQFSPTTRP